MNGLLKSDKLPTLPLAPATRTAPKPRRGIGNTYGDQAKASQPPGGGRGVRGGAARGRRVQAAAGRGKAVAAVLRAWEAEGEVQRVRRVVDMRARPPPQRVQGVRRGVDMRARRRTQAMQGVRRGGDMRARPPTQPVQGVRRVVDMRARPRTQHVQGVRRGVDMRARPPTPPVQGVQGAEKPRRAWRGGRCTTTTTRCYIDGDGGDIGYKTSIVSTASGISRGGFPALYARPHGLCRGNDVTTGDVAFQLTLSPCRTSVRVRASGQIEARARTVAYAELRGN